MTPLEIFNLKRKFTSELDVFKIVPWETEEFDLIDFRSEMQAAIKVDS